MKKKVKGKKVSELMCLSICGRSVEGLERFCLRDVIHAEFQLNVERGELRRKPMRFRKISEPFNAVRWNFTRLHQNEVSEQLIGHQEVPNVLRPLRVLSYFAYLLCLHILDSLFLSLFLVEVSCQFIGKSDVRQMYFLGNRCI